MDIQPLRRACNRCHSLKLRCDRGVAEQHCVRCLKARAACVFSFSTRGGQPVSSARPTREESVAGNSTENVSISESPVSDPEASPDTCRDDMPPDSLCQYVQHASPLDPTTLAPTPLADSTCSDCYSTGETLRKDPRAGMDFLTNLSSSNYVGSNVVAPMPNKQTYFRVQFMKDLLVLDIELIQHASTLAIQTDDSLLQATSDRTLSITQQMLITLDWVECWASHASYPQTWGPYQYQPLMPSESEQLDTSLDQTSTVHALSTYLRLVEVCENLFTRAASNHNASVANGPWNPFPSLHVNEYPVGGFAMQSALFIQSIVPLLYRLSHTMQLLAKPFVEANVVKAMLATIREHERRMMQKFAQLQEVVSV